MADGSKGRTVAEQHTSDRSSVVIQIGHFLYLPNSHAVAYKYTPPSSYGSPTSRFHTTNHRLACRNMAFNPLQPFHVEKQSQRYSELHHRPLSQHPRCGDPPENRGRHHLPTPHVVQIQNHQRHRHRSRDRHFHVGLARQRLAHARDVALGDLGVWRFTRRGRTARGAMAGDLFYGDQVYECGHVHLLEREGRESGRGSEGDF